MTWLDELIKMIHPPRGEKNKRGGCMPRTDEERGYKIVDSERLPSKLRINEIETKVKVSSVSGRAFVNVPKGWAGKTLKVYRDFVEGEDSDAPSD